MLLLLFGVVFIVFGVAVVVIVGNFVIVAVAVDCTTAFAEHARTFSRAQHLALTLRILFRSIDEQPIQFLYPGLDGLHGAAMALSRPLRAFLLRRRRFLRLPHSRIH